MLDSIAVEGCALRNRADVAANKNLIKVHFTANLPRKGTPCGNIESQVMKEVAGEGI